MSYGILFDTTQCVGCEGCMYACREKNDLPENTEYKLSSKNYTVVKSKNDVYYRQMCMHCEDPACASACPVAALQKTEAGPVVYDPDACMGCRYCMVACPFNVPKYEWGSANPVVSKCVMCYDRVAEGEMPACAEACPTGATTFGKRDDLLKEAHRRLEESPDMYYQHVYGEKEAGGTSVLYLSSIPFPELGFEMGGYYKQAFPEYTWKVMKEIPNIVAFGGIFMFGLWWIINRRMELEDDPMPMHSDGKELK
ncbi:MAG: 4Fe-4S dicluster domain-containing protein [Candidatus Marinimicrobia bacterium]|nr:4Fe-4S dicluster domain-containing protein [Candidatus Neomarinimicrobiota bacterium]MCF7827577.1 4Fe-4S dicluster domain-containing protein [Candidatus Neomarinimicrobiota bacterium]MCF7881561.1 4Fe-4S dicluster domain-containing protein [Candidatus Neomarinimicrobiota bacterium]